MIELKPFHFFIGVAIVAGAIFLLPAVTSAYNSAFPPAGSFERRAIDECANTWSGFNRWSGEDIHKCLVVQRLRR